MTTELVELADKLEALGDQMYLDDDAETGGTLWFHANELTLITDQLRALASRAGGWRTIDSAPREIEPNTKCGEVIMLGGPGWSSQGFYHDGSHCYGHRGKAGFFDSEDWGPDRLLIASNVHPTHWQPMIEPPAAPEPVAVGS